MDRYELWVKDENGWRSWGVYSKYKVDLESLARDVVRIHKNLVDYEIRERE